MDRYSVFLLFGAWSPLFFRNGKILGQDSRLHYFSRMDRYSDFLLFGASSPLFFSGMDRCLDFFLFGASYPLFFNDGQILGLSSIRGLVSVIFQGWTDIRTFSYSVPRLHYFSGMDRYSDFLLFGASSPLFFRNGQILGQEPRLCYFSGMDRYLILRLSSIRGLVFIIFHNWTDTQTGASSPLFFIDGQIL